MLHISLFSGIGGFDLAAEWMGWTNIVSCEINDFGNKVLEHYWPNAYHHRDVKTLTLETINKKLGENWRTDDVILTGGFPCQPYSSAGKRKGKEDERHLWPEMLRVIREIKPKYIVGENVAGLLSWSGGLVFDEVHSDLEAEGYEVQAVVIPAAAVNAPHGRDRVWFVAHSNSNTTRPSGKSGSIKTSWSGNNDEQDKWGGKTELNTRSSSFSWTTPHSNGNGLHTSDSGHEEQPSEGRVNAQRDADEIYKKQSVIEHSNSIRQKWRMYKDKSKNAIQFEFSERNTRSFRMPTWDNFPTVSPVCFRDDGLSNRLDGITFSKWRKESIKAAGNAVVPQVVYEIFKAIEATRK